MKKDKADRITLYVDKDVYKEYKIYAIQVGKSVSSLIEKFMRSELKKINKEK